MARLFISYKREEQDYAFAVRQWLIDEQAWSSEDIFVDAGHLHAGDDWETKLLAEAEAANVILFLASDKSLDVNSFCYRELRHATGDILTVTIKGVAPDDTRIQRAIPDRAKMRQIAALDQQPTDAFSFVSPRDGRTGAIALNRKQVESIGATLRELGVAPNSFTWTKTPAGPYPGLRPLMEGDEAILFGRDLEIRDGLTAINELRATVTKRALVFQAPSGAGKSSYLRAGLWRRLRQQPGFTPLAIVRSAKGIVRNDEWGFAAGLYDAMARSERLGKNLSLTLGEIEDRVKSDLPGLLALYADADAGPAGRRTLLIGIDQSEEMTALSTEDDAELDHFLAQVLEPRPSLDIRLVLTARDDSVDATLARLAKAGLPQDQVETQRLHRLPPTRFDDIINGPAKAAERAGWPLTIEPQLVDAFVSASANGDSGDALPILALAMQRLVSKHRAPDGRINLQPKDAAKFVERAVADATAEGLVRAGMTAGDLRRLVIPRLATWDPQAGAEGAAKRQVASAADLFDGDRAALAKLADALVDQRLLTRSMTETGAVYEVAHEALLRVAPLGDLIFERRENFEQARVLKIEARDWIAANKVEARLGRSGDRLKDADALLLDEDFGNDLKRSGQDIQAYVDACKNNERAQLDKQRRIIGRAFVKPALAALADGLSEHALRLAAAGALLAEDTGLTLVPELWSPMAKSITSNRTDRVLKGHEKAVKVTAFSPDGKRVVTGSYDNTARLWDAESGAEIAVLKAHSRAINAASFSPDGKRVVTGSDDNTARLWDAESGAEIAVLKAHSDTVLAASFSPDGKRVVTGSDDNTARLWDAESGAEIAVLKAHTNWVRAASFSPDGKRVVTGSSDNTARLWDAESGAEIAVLKAHTNWVRAASFSPDGKRVVTGSSDNTARLWDAESGAEIAVLKAHSDTVLAASFSPDGKRVVTGSYDNTARLWDAESGAEIAVLKAHSDTVLAASFSPDGKRVVTGSDDNTARLWDAESGAEIAVLKAHSDTVLAASFSPDGKRVVTGSSDNTARLWDAESGAEIAVLKAHSDTVLAASFSPDGKRVVTGSDDNTARLWDAESGAEIAVLKAHTNWVRAASFSPDGKRVVTGSSDNTARLWDAESGAEIAVLKAHTNWVRAASFSPDGKRVVTGSSDNTARLWDAESGAEIAVLKAHSDTVLAASFSPDGKRVVTGSDDNTARLWDAESGAEIAVLKAHSDTVLAASFSPDGKRVVTGSSDNTARLWDAESGAEIAVLKAHSDTVLAASFSPDGKRVVTGSYDNTARLWDAESGAEIAVLKAHTNWVRAASFSPDGKRVVTGSSDNTARLWDAESGAEIAVLKAHSDTVLAASFSPDGKRVVTGSSDNTAKIFDVSRSEAVTRGHALVLTAALARSIGWRTEPERGDLLMEGLSDDDMFGLALAKIGRTAGDPELQAVITALHAPLHPNCYLSPTQFAEKFGLGGAASTDEGADGGESLVPSDDAGPELAEHVAFYAHPVTADDLDGQTYIENHRGVAIFQLRDGRFHVIANFAVATLDEARAAAEAIAKSTKIEAA